MNSKEKTKIVLPRGWVVRPSSKFPDRVYYFNVYTGESMWKPPTKSGKPNVDNTKQNDMEWKKGSIPEQRIARKEPAETARIASESSSSSNQYGQSSTHAFPNAAIKEHDVTVTRKRTEVSPSSTTSADSDKYVQKKKPLESGFRSSGTLKVPNSVNNSTNNVNTVKGLVSKEKYDQQSELLQANLRTASKAQHSRSDSDSGINSSISEDQFLSLPPSLKREPIKVNLPSQCASSIQKNDTELGLPTTKTHSHINLKRQREKFDLRHVLEDRRRTKILREPLPSDLTANGYIKEGIRNSKRCLAGGAAKGVAQRRMQSLRETLAKEKEANEKKACEVQEKSLTPKKDVSGTPCKNFTPKNENLQKPADGKLNNGYSSSTATAEVSPPFRKRRSRRRKSKRNQKSCLDQYKDGGLEAFFTKDAPAKDSNKNATKRFLSSETEVPSKIRRVQQPTSESSSTTVWYPKNNCDADVPRSIDLDSSSPADKNLGTTRLVKLRQSLSDGVAQQDVTDLYQNSEEYPTSVPPEENKYPGAEVHTYKEEDESVEELESMDWEPLEELSVSVQWTQDNNKSNTTDKNNEWYIVIDTNVFVSNLKIVEELRDMNDKVLGYPVLIIPSVVLTELEGIKNRSPVDKSPKGATRAAIKFINYHLRKSHPRIRAQGALSTVAVPELEIETGDDKILHCCLLLLKQTDRVILLTNDCNLRNRAKSFSIIASHHLDIQDAIQELYHCSSQPKLDALRSEGTSTMLQPSQPKTAGQIEAAKVDTITCKLKSTLKDVLSKFLQAEMEVAFGDMWKKVILIKPPWSVLQVLECLCKHWIAVVAFVLPAHAKELIEKLYDFFNEKYESHGLGHALAEVKDILEISFQLCTLLPTSKPYDDLTSLSITVIEELMGEVEEDSSLGVAVPEINSNNISNGNEGVTVQDESNSCEAQGIEAVHRALDRIYLYILSFCGTMFDVLELPHDIPYSRPERLPSLTSVREAFPEVYSKLRSLLEVLRSVLQSSPVVLTIDHAIVQGLYLSIIKFFEEEVHNPIAIKSVLDFCAPDQREMLEGALSKLVECESMLNIGMDHIVKLVVQ